MAAIDEAREPWCANCGSSDPSAPCAYGGPPSEHVMVLALVEIEAALDGLWALDDQEPISADPGWADGYTDAQIAARRVLLGEGE